MRKLYKVVAVGALALGLGACSQDIFGPDYGPQYGRGAGSIQRDTTTASTEAPGSMSDCGWQKLRMADNQLEKGSCK